MRKINKIINIALIFMLIVVFLCSDLAYSLPIPITTLRPQLGKEDDTLTRSREAIERFASNRDEQVKIENRIRELESLGITSLEKNLFFVLSTLAQPFDVLKKRAMNLDKIPGLHVSYKAGPGIDKVDPKILIPRTETITDNLLILNAHGIDHIAYFPLLRSDTEKLKRNILFLESIDFDFTKYPILLGLPTRLLQTNHMILNDLGIELTASRLQKNRDKLIEEIIEEVRTGKIQVSQRLKKMTDYLGQVTSGKKTPQLIVSIEEKEGRRVTITRGETIKALKKLGIKNPDLYPSMIALGAPIIAQRIKILKQPNPAYQFSGIKNPLTWPQILTYSPFTILGRSVELKTPDPSYNFNGIKKPESCPQIYGYDILTVKTRAKTLKTPDRGYNFNGIGEPENYPLILTQDPQLTKSKVKKIKNKLHIDNIEEHPMLLQGDVGYLMDKAKDIDAIDGLRVSYKEGPGIDIVDPTILLANPETIEDNISLLRKYKIDYIRHLSLLKSSTIKLKMNIMVCEIMGFDFIRYPNILMLSTNTLVTNYTILKDLDTRIALDYLGRSTEALVQRIKAGKVPINTKLSPKKVNEYLERAREGRIHIPRNIKPNKIRRIVENSATDQVRGARAVPNVSSMRHIRDKI